MLQSFKNGIDEGNAERNCRLILCTSVLEEGLDVQSCNRVFRIGGRGSLIQVMQSKGRARCLDGKMDVIVRHTGGARIQR